MSIEAMKQWREALKEYCEHGTIFMPLTALKSIDQAIAEAEKQEPLTYLLRRQDRSGYETGEKTDYGAFPVYTHPQPKREWVELTPEEEDALVEQAREFPAEVPCPDYNKRLLTLANSKLKDKNT